MNEGMWVMSPDAAPCLPGVTYCDGADLRHVGSWLTPCWFILHYETLPLSFTEAGSFKSWTWEMCTRIFGMYGLEERMKSAQQRLGMRNKLQSTFLDMHWGSVWRWSLTWALASVCNNIKHAYYNGPSRENTLWGYPVWRWRFITSLWRLSGRSWTFFSQTILRNWKYTQSRSYPF